MGYIRLNTSDYPIVVTEMVGDFSVKQAEEYCTELELLGERGQRIGAITDLSRTSVPSLKVRGVLRKFTQEHQRISDRTTVCSAIVLKSAAIKMVVSAIFLVVRTAYPQKAFSQLEHAQVWVQEQMQQAQDAA